MANLQLPKIIHNWKTKIAQSTASSDQQPICLIVGLQLPVKQSIPVSADVPLALRNSTAGEYPNDIY